MLGVGVAAEVPETLTLGTKNHAIKRTPAHDRTFQMSAALPFPPDCACLVRGL